MTGPVFSRAKTQTRTLDDTLTPLEIAALLQSRAYNHMPFAIAPLLRQGPPVGYRRHDLGEHVKFYSADCGAPDLIVGFCGRARRLMLPISYFLQMMRDDLHDVLILVDVNGRHYDGGVAGYSASLIETLQNIETFVTSRGYRNVIIFGTSMGGFVALRAGLWLGVPRAISIGGGFCHHPPRLLEPKHEIRAFDLLCACRPSRKASLLAAHAARNVRDAEQHAVLQQVLPGCTAIRVDTEMHNVLQHLDTLGDLSSFFARIFSFETIGAG